MPVSNLLTTLVERLLLLSTEGKIAWQETADANAFQASVSQYVVTVSKSRDPEDDYSWAYEIRVADRRGRLVEEALSADLVPLFDAARRKAMNVDKHLTELISSLDSIGRSK
jgi:hypothetical protein